jgi:hypothetical protein
MFEGLMGQRVFQGGSSFGQAIEFGPSISRFADLGDKQFCITVPFHFFIANAPDVPGTFDFRFRVFWLYDGFDAVDAGVRGFQNVEIIDVMSDPFE